MADAYEREHMPGIGEVLYRHKVTVPRWVMGLTAGLPAAIIAGLAATVAISESVLGGLAIFGGAALYAGLSLALSVTFATARIAVSEGEVHLQLGFAGPRIPIGEVSAVHIGPSGLRKYGMGVTRLLGGTTVFTLFGDHARAVHIERAHGKPIVIVGKDSEALAQAIREAMARHARKGPRVRVEAPAIEHVEPESEASPKDEARADRQGR